MNLCRILITKPNTFGNLVLPQPEEITYDILGKDPLNSNRFITGNQDNFLLCGLDGWMNGSWEQRDTSNDGLGGIRQPLPDITF